MDKVEVLRRCPLFGGFTEVGLRILAGIAEERRVPAGEWVFVEGAPSEAMYVLYEGEAVLTLDVDGTKRPVGTVGPTTALGELALVAPASRQVTARAVEDCTLLQIRRTDFLQLQRKKPQACLKLLMAIVQQFGERVVDAPDLWRRLLADPR